MASGAACRRAGRSRLVLLLALLTFVAVRYLYTTAGGRFGRLTNLFGAAWAISLLVILWQWHDVPRALVIASLAFPAYYMGASWLISLRR